MPTLKDIYDWAMPYIKNKESGVTFSEINTIISYVTGIPKEYLLINPDTRLSASNIRRIKKAIQKRSTHYPLQYIIGLIEFMGINFHITPGVLIPRQETELVVETALEYIKKFEYKTVLDLCCGSGVIGLSIAFFSQGIIVSFIDNSAKAINLTKKNSKLLGLTERSSFYKGDLFSPLSGSRFDLIVSNPPYVPSNRIKHLPEEVLYEPIDAIDGGNRGLMILKKILYQAGNYLNKSGMLIIEHDDTHKEYLKKISTVEPNIGIKYVKTINDLSGLPRVSVFIH